MLRPVPLYALLLFTSAASAAEVDYARQIKPLLATRCYACHGALKQEAGLRLDTAAAMRKGGDSGAAFQIGQSDASLLLERVTHADVELRMPPEGEGAPLNAAEVELLKSWIDAGAKSPGDERPEPDPREHWAFRAPVRPDVPQIAGGTSGNPIDAFLAVERAERGLTIQPPADKRILLRRVYLDLVGLPPTAEQLEAFLADDTQEAYAKVVDHLLASPQYGERWGRHWMDVWRYSDWWGLGAEVRNSQKHIWQWRDWIIESLNDDVGYDEMLRQMLAADELYPNDLSKLRASGFLARHYFKFNRNSWLEETVEHTSKAFLGLTLNCARCHDHKYDPISHRDYYRFRAFFEPYQIRTDQVPGQTDYEQNGIPRAFDCNLQAATYRFLRGDEKRPASDEPLMPGVPALLSLGPFDIEPVRLPLEAHQPGLRGHVLENYLAVAEREIAAAKAAVVSASAQSKNEPVGSPHLTSATLNLAEKALIFAEQQPDLWQARAAADRARFTAPPADNAPALRQAAALAERRSALAKAEEVVARAELELLKAADAKKTEVEKQLVAAREALEKAKQAIEQPGELYTSLSGALKTLESNVETAEHRNLPFPETSTGRRTALAKWMTDRRHPTVARVAVNHIWLRHMGAPLVPTVFDVGRKGTPPTHPDLLDWLAVELMENQWSMKHLHRLIVTSSAYRLSSSNFGGETNRAIDGDNRYYWRMNAGRLESQAVRDSLLHLAGDLDLARGGPSIPVAQADASRRRSLYFVHSHNEHARLLSLFDDANVLDCYRRDQSIVPQQALALSNSKLAQESSAKIAARIDAVDDVAFIRQAFVLLLANEPNDQELQTCTDALAAWTTAGIAPDRARTNLVQALINHNDFISIR